MDGHLLDQGHFYVACSHICLHSFTMCLPIVLIRTIQYLKLRVYIVVGCTAAEKTLKHTKLFARKFYPATRTRQAWWCDADVGESVGRSATTPGSRRAQTV